MIIQAYNPSTVNLEKSYLTSNYAVGVTSIDVRNSDSFSSTTFSRIMIGEMGNENTEIVTVSNVNANKRTLTIGATKFPHTASDPVYVLTYDQIRFYRSTTGIDGTYTVSATVNMDVDNENLQTLYNDSTGVTSYYYKITFYHSVDARESELSDAIPGEGYGEKQAGTLVSEILTEVGDEQQEFITVPQMLGLFNECSEDLIGQSRKPYRFLATSTLLDIVADNDRVALPDDLLRMDRVQYNRVDGAANSVMGNLKVVSIEEMEYMQYNQSSLVSAIPVGLNYIAIDDSTNEFVLYPKPTTSQTDKLKIYYWTYFDPITSLASTFQTPVKRIYKLFVLSRYYMMRSRKDNAYMNLATTYDRQYNAEVIKLQRAQKIDVGSPMSFLPDTRTPRGLRRSV